MNKEIKISLVVSIGFLSFLWLEKPLREFLVLGIFNDFNAEQISSIIIRTTLVFAAAILIKKLNLIAFTGLNSWKKFKNIQAIFIPLTFVLMGLVGNWNTYANTPSEMLILFFLSNLAVGILEELVFRGTIFPLMMKAFLDKRRPILISAVLSSLMFGVVHYVNLFSQPENLIGITSQVFFALAIGVFFCGLMTRTENILIPILLHALVNLSFGAGKLKNTIEQTSKDKITEIDWNSLIPTTLFFLFIFLGGVYMISKSDKENILRKVKIE